MRKVRPQDVCAAYIDQVDDSLAHYHRVVTALNGTSREMADVSNMAKMLMHSIFVDFECFLSDLFIAYLNRDFSQYRTRFMNSVRASAADKHSALLSSKIQFDIPVHMKIDDIADAIDPTGWNLTFKTSKVMKDKARDYLVDPYKTKILDMDASDELLVDTARAIRNWIAHQSDGSKTIMNDMLIKLERSGGGNSGLGRDKRKVKDIGSFLKATVNGIPRVELYGERLQEVARSITYNQEVPTASAP